jgi:GT2 family glycosyltransferase
MNMMQNNETIPIPEESVDLPATSLLICSRNRPQLLWETIESILAGDEVPAEMIIIDQSDVPDPHLSAFQPEQACAFRYLWSEQKGVSLGRNRAAAEATHSILAITDDDMLATPTWFGSIIRVLVKNGTGNVVTGQVLTTEEDELLGYAPSTREDEQAVVYEGRVNRDILFSGNMAINKATFQEVGGFDTRLGPGTSFPAAEDNDFAFRLLEAGCCIIYDPQAVLYHRAWRSEKEFIWLHWRYGYGQGAFYAKHFSLRDRFMIKRMVWDIWAYLSRFPLRFWRDRRQAYQDGLFATGLLAGSLHWSLRSPRRSPRK